MKSTITLMAMLASSLVLSVPASASEPIRPYKETGKFGHFKCAIYNNRWLLHGKRAEEEKDITRVAITGVMTGVRGKLVIPSEIEGHEVYGIDENALKTCWEVTSIVIPKTVRFLKPGTLNRCESLENILVAEDHPDFSSVDGVMFDKKKTTLLAVGSGRDGEYKVPATTTAIGPSAFAHCTKLKSIVIPESVTDIGGRQGGVFQGCTSLERITLPGTVTNIGQKSFQDCTGLKEVGLSGAIKEIPFGLFWRCSNLGRITLPDDVASIGNYAFAGCKKMKLQRLPVKLTKIGAYAFKDCESLGKLTVPESVTTIDRGAFRGTKVDVGERE